MDAVVELLEVFGPAQAVLKDQTLWNTGGLAAQCDGHSIWGTPTIEPPIEAS
jgi:hypothetical protein